MLDYYNAIPLPIVILSQDSTIFHVNSATEKNLGLPVSDILNMSNHTLFHPSHFTVSDCPVCHAINNACEVIELEIEDTIKKTVTKYSISSVNDDETSYRVQMCTDVTETYQNRQKIKKLQEHTRLALNGHNAGTWEWDFIDNSIYYSPELKEMLGFKRDEPLSNTITTWKVCVHPDELEKVLRRLNVALYKKQEQVESIHRLKHNDGHWIWVLERAIIKYDENAKPIRMIGMDTDITKQKLEQYKFEERGKILDNSRNEIYIFGAESLKFLYLNKGAKRNIGYSYKEMKQLTPLDIKPEMTEENFQTILEPILNQQKDDVQFSTVHQRKNGSTYQVDVYLQATEYQGQKACVAIILDVTKRVEAEKIMSAQRKILHHKAHHHTLTGLPNRLLFTEILEESMKKAHSKKTLLALFFIDLDKFKMINDQYGHGVGDDVLRIVALRLKGVIRDRDTAAHISGDEFVIIMKDFNTVENTSILANKLLKTLRKPIKVGTHEFSLSGSIGISFYSEDVKETHILLKNADIAMYHAKNSGRDNFKYYNPDIIEDYSI